MSGDNFGIVRGSGNVFRDFGDPDADLEQARAILAAKIVRVLDARSLTVGAAAAATGVGASEFSRIRRLRLERFTIDRMIRILGKLGQEVEFRVTVRPRVETRLRPARSGRGAQTPAAARTTRRSA